MHNGTLALAALGLLLVALPASAQPDPGLPGLDEIPLIGDELIDVEGAQQQLSDLVGGEEPAQPDEPAPPAKSKEPGFADRVAQAIGDDAVSFSLAGVATAVLTAGGFALVTRYISPKEALKNPQRAMLYGFVRATPGVHLKQLSEEFGMKTSSILWHIRKLESAELVKSERVNGFRVFYPVEGGVEIRKVSRALATLQNDNALHIYQYIERHPGTPAAAMAERLSLHGGTARWHLRKLRDHGLLDELVQSDGSRFYPTPLGNRALEAREGRPVDAPARPVGTPALSE